MCDSPVDDAASWAETQTWEMSAPAPCAGCSPPPSSPPPAPHGQSGSPPASPPLYPPSNQHYQNHGEIIYGGTRWIEDDCPDTFSEFIFLFPLAAALCHDF